MPFSTLCRGAALRIARRIHPTTENPRNHTWRRGECRRSARDDAQAAVGLVGVACDPGPNPHPRFPSLLAAMPLLHNEDIAPCREQVQKHTQKIVPTPLPWLCTTASALSALSALCLRVGTVTTPPNPEYVLSEPGVNTARHAARQRAVVSGGDTGKVATARGGCRLGGDRPSTIAMTAANRRQAAAGRANGQEE